MAIPLRMIFFFLFIYHRLVLRNLVCYCFTSDIALWRKNLVYIFCKWCQFHSHFGTSESRETISNKVANKRERERRKANCFVAASTFGSIKLRIKLPRKRPWKSLRNYRNKKMWMTDKNLSKHRKIKIYWFHLAKSVGCVCSPDKTETCSISNPKVNRILNKIAIRAISSFLSLIFHNNFPFAHLFIHTLAFFFLVHSFSSGNNMKSEFLLIWTTLLQFFSALRKYKREWMNLFPFWKTPIICGFHSNYPQTDHQRSFTWILCMFLESFLQFSALTLLHKIFSSTSRYFGRYLRAKNSN